MMKARRLGHEVLGQGNARLEVHHQVPPPTWNMQDLPRRAYAFDAIGQPPSLSMELEKPFGNAQRAGHFAAVARDVYSGHVGVRGEHDPVLRALDDGIP